MMEAAFYFYFQGGLEIPSVGGVRLGAATDQQLTTEGRSTAVPAFCIILGVR